MSRIVSRAPGATAAVGLSLVVLGTASYVLPPHWILSAVLLGIAGTALFVAGAATRHSRVWLVLLALAGCTFTALTGGEAARVLALRTLGQTERCAVSNVTGRTVVHGGVPSTTNHWTVSCPDGIHEFDLTAGLQLRDADGAITMVMVPGGMIEAEPAILVRDNLALLLAIPSIAILLVVVLLLAARGPRSPV